MLAPIGARGTGEGAGVRRPRIRAGAWIHLLLAVGVACVAFGALFAGPTLTLTDGRKISGVDLRKDGDVFVLTLADGSALPVPIAAVKQMEWTGGGRSEGRPAQPANVVTGWTAEEHQDYEQRAAVRAQENDAWRANMEAERAAREKQKAQQEYENWVKWNAGYNQPSGFIGSAVVWQPDVAGSTQQPSYWVPTQNANDWLWGAPEAPH